MSPGIFLCVAVLSCAAPSVDTTLVVSDDPELGDMAARLLSEVSERAGMSLSRPVRVEKRSRAALESYLIAKLDEELPPAKADQITAVYSLLGQASPDLDLRSLLASVYEEQVVGFYEPDSVALFIVDDQPPETIEPILVHELVHAIQDQNLSLDSLTADERGNDAQVAAQAAIEGHATLVMMEWMFSKLGGTDVDFEDLPDFRGMVTPMLESVRTQYPMLAQAPKVVQEGLLYPYIEGAGYVMEVWKKEEGRPSPIGAYLPHSTEQVSDPQKRLGAERDHPIQVLFEDEGVVYQNGLGKAELRVVLEEWSGDEEDRRFAEGWAGDQFALYGGSGQWSLSWAIVWDDLDARDAFAVAVPDMVGLPAGLIVESTTFDGHAAVSITIGSPPSGAVRTFLREGL